MDRAAKQKLVEELRQVFTETEVVVVVQNAGLTVAQMTDLRRQIKAAGASFKVTKNRLTRLALDGTRYQQIDGPLFKGPTGIATSSDPVGAAKVIVEFAKKNDKLVLLGGAMGDSKLDVNSVKAFATLPSLDALRGKIIGLIQAPATKIAGVLSRRRPVEACARVLSAYGSKDEAKKQRES